MVAYKGYYRDGKYYKSKGEYRKAKKAQKQKDLENIDSNMTIK